MIELQGLTIEGFVQNVDVAVPDGAFCKIITETDLSKDALLDVLAGVRQPERGRVSLLGIDIWEAPAEQPIQLFRNVGVVWRGGGMISNLRVWENIALPSEYHLGLRPRELEGRVGHLIGCLKEAAGRLSARMSSLPAHLLEHELTAAGLVRTMLMEPHLLIYDSIFEGLAARASRELASCIAWFHGQREGRTSVFITSDERSLGEIKADMIIRQNGTVLEEGGE